MFFFNFFRGLPFRADHDLSTCQSAHPFVRQFRSRMGPAWSNCPSRSDDERRNPNMRGRFHRPP